ncbi:MAG: glycosyltransferase family 2 protein [Pseudomonadales bacterium]|nr:glycosyltransferase family 2 protein [Pseudomonadales bacterium]
MNLAVVITTYNSPLWLERVLWGYEQQSDTDFEVIIADDGSSQATQDLIDAFKARNKLNILHVWHEDQGFRKTEILNKAIVKTTSDYLVFTDGDCIPRADFIAVHKALSEPGKFLSGGYFKLNMPVSELVSEKDIASGDVFDADWLQQQGQPKSHKMMKLTAKGFKARLLEVLTPTKATWNGMNSSTWKADIIAVNGFNEEMQYGGLDREMGERMMNAGLKGKQIRYSAICLHLDHKRGYATPETWEKNRSIRQRVKKEKLTWADKGIKNR